MVDNLTLRTLSYQEIKSKMGHNLGVPWVFPHEVAENLDMNNNSMADVNDIPQGERFMKLTGQEVVITPNGKGINLDQETALVKAPGGGFFYSTDLVIPSNWDIGQGGQYQFHYADFDMARLRSGKAEDLISRVKAAAATDPLVGSYVGQIELDPQTAEQHYFKRTSDGNTNIFFIREEVGADGKTKYFISMNVGWRNYSIPLLQTRAIIELRNYIRRKKGILDDRIQGIQDLQVIAKTLTDLQRPELFGHFEPIPIETVMDTFNPKIRVEAFKKLFPRFGIPEGEVNEEYLRRVGLIFSDEAPAVPAEVRKEEESPSSEIKDREDAAMIKTSSPGGIDFNPNNLIMETRGSGIDFQLPANAQNLPSIPFDGLFPVIIQIVPVTTLPFMVGAEENSEAEVIATRL